MNISEKYILFAGGGTGGHVYPAVASIEELRQRGHRNILYVGGYRGIENKIVPQFKLDYKKIWISGFQRYFTWRNIIFPVKLAVSLLQSLAILIKYKPAVVIGTGGYVSGPVIYAAAKMAIPTMIQEQDSFPGVTTRLLAKYADVICLSYPEAENYLRKIKGRLVVTGNPLRNSLRLPDRQTAVRHWGLQPDKPVVFIFGGSQGARSINNAIEKIIIFLIQNYTVQILWQTGQNHYQDIAARDFAALPEIRILSYIDDMGKAYAAADIIICRAGAITLAELSLAAKAAILVPYPHAAADHQLKNASAIAEKGAALLVQDNEQLETNLKKAIEYLLNNQNEKEKMSKIWKEIYRPDAAKKIVDQIINLMNKN